MKRTAMAGLFVCAAMLASPVFAEENLCDSNLKQIDNTLATLVATSESAKDDINADIKKAKDEKAAGNIQGCISTTTQVIQNLQNLIKGGDDK